MGGGVINLTGTYRLKYNMQSMGGEGYYPTSLEVELADKLPGVSKLYTNMQNDAVPFPVSCKADIVDHPDGDWSSAPLELTLKVEGHKGYFAGGGSFCNGTDNTIDVVSKISEGGVTGEAWMEGDCVDIIGSVKL